MAVRTSRRHHRSRLRLRPARSAERRSFPSARPQRNFKSVYYELTEARCNPKPVQRPHPPLCIGGSDEKRTLRTVARFAQHWNFDSGTPQQFRRAREVLYEHCSRVGRDPSEIRLSAQVRFDGDPARTAARAAEFAAVGAELAVVHLPLPYPPYVLEPLADELATGAGGLTG